MLELGQVAPGTRSLFFFLLGIKPAASSRLVRVSPSQSFKKRNYDHVCMMSKKVHHGEHMEVREHLV